MTTSSFMDDIGRQARRCRRVLYPPRWLFLLWFWQSLALAGTFELALVGEADDSRSAAVMAAAESALASSCAQPCASRVTRLEPDGRALQSPDRKWDLVVAVGSKAGRAVATSAIDAPRLLTFIPEVAWRELQACCVDPQFRHAALFIDQPLQRQLALIGQLDPSARRIGVLLGGVSARHRAQLSGLARSSALSLQLVDVDEADQIGPRLRTLVREADVLLALPDPGIYNPGTVYPILLTTYSARIPVIGFSEAMVKAGAAAAVYASPQDVGAEIADIVEVYRSSGRFDSSGHGTRFSVSVNDDVARSLRLPPVSASDLRERLKETNP